MAKKQFMTTRSTGLEARDG
jgi:hypothetical protein